MYEKMLADVNNGINVHDVDVRRAKLQRCSFSKQDYMFAMLRTIIRPGACVARSVVASRRLLSANAAEAAVGSSEDVTAPTLSHKTSPKVTSLADEIVSLNMLEVKALTETLKERLGVDDALAMPAMNPALFAGMSGAPAATPGPVEAAAPEKTSFDLKLEAYDAAKKIAVIKEIRAITNLGLKEAKALVDGIPKVFKTAVPKDEAEQIRDKLKEIGATVALD